jgi:3-deoxy-manno-octulosonate cytidylyltransferase (CMP-KDO synthetase)
MKYTVVIPARFASSRLPAKPLKDIGGKTMIERVYLQAKKSQADRVVVATDDERIEAEVTRFGGEVCMTSVDHNSGTDRLQEVADKLGLSDSEIVVNVQGDEPLIPPAVIDQVAQNLAAANDASVSTLCEPIENIEDFRNPNIVKVVTDINGYALYFSRAAIPWPRDEFSQAAPSLPEVSIPQTPMFRRHIGIYGYRVSLLNHFVTWPVAPIEELECLEQLRVMWQGHRIHVADAVEAVPGGVDTEEDLLRIRQLITD